MTRPEIMLMSKEELRVEAAKLMGFYQKCVWPTHGDSDQTAWPWFDKEGNRMCGCPDFPCDTTAAMELWDQIAEPKEITWEDGYICLSWGEAPEAWIKGKITGPDTLPDLLTRTYVWAKTP